MLKLPRMRGGALGAATVGVALVLSGCGSPDETYREPPTLESSPGLADVLAEPAFPSEPPLPALAPGQAPLFLDPVGVPAPNAPLAPALPPAATF